MIELKKCPFCGSEPKIIREDLDERFSYAKKVTYKCPSCLCERSAIGVIGKSGYADNSTVEKRALDSWQTRF